MLLLLQQPRILWFYGLTTLSTLINGIAQPDWRPVFLLELMWRVAVLAYIMDGWRCARNHTPAEKHSKPTPPRTKRQLFSCLVERLFIAIPFIISGTVPLLQLPFVWESCIWTAQVDLFMAVALLVASSTIEDPGATTRADMAQHAADTIQEMFAVFYFASGFWKINTYFLDTTASCATLFVVQNLAYYIPHRAVAFHLARWLVPWAPVATILVETAMGLGLMVARGWPTRTTRALALVLFFHLAVCATPRPNDISIFAVECAARLAVMVPCSGWRGVLGDGRRLWSTAAIPTLVVTFILAYGRQHEFTPNNWAFLLFVPIMGLELRAAAAATTNVVQGDATKTCPQSRRPKWMYGGTIIAILYSFVPILLGVMDEALPNMFANLKLHGGSNHLVLPTGWVWEWYRDAPDAWTYGGGIVRVEPGTTSTWLRVMHPSDLTSTVEPQGVVADLMAALGASRPFYFHSGKNRNLGLADKGLLQPSDPLIPYTLPALELKRLLKEAMVREHDRPFRVVWAHLDGVHGDEVWRATSWKRRFTVEFERGAIVRCRVQQYPASGGHTWLSSSSSSSSRPCSPTDLPFHLDVPSLLAPKLAAYHGYPVVLDAEGTVRAAIPCFGY